MKQQLRTDERLGRRVFEVREDRLSPGDWRAESIDFEGEGECASVIFVGNEAEAMAKEYEAWKNSRLADPLALRSQ